MLTCKLSRHWLLTLQKQKAVKAHFSDEKLQENETHSTPTLSLCLLSPIHRDHKTIVLGNIKIFFSLFCAPRRKYHMFCGVSAAVANYHRVQN